MSNFITAKKVLHQILIVNRIECTSFLIKYISISKSADSVFLYSVYCLNANLPYEGLKHNFSEKKPKEILLPESFILAAIHLFHGIYSYT